MCGFDVACTRCSMRGQDMTTTTRAYAEAMRKEIHTLAAELMDELGPTPIQAMTGTKDRTMPSRWAHPDGPNTQKATEQKLRLGYRVWVMLRDAETASMAAAWMLGVNPYLGEDLTPLTAIREERAGDVVGTPHRIFRSLSALFRGVRDFLQTICGLASASRTVRPAWHWAHCGSRVRGYCCEGYQNVCDSY